MPPSQSASSARPWGVDLDALLSSANGARFWKVALQVCPYSWLEHQGRLDSTDEATHNAAIVAACLRNGIEVIGITDHHRFDPSADSLRRAAEDAGIVVFPGFEYTANDNVQAMVYFEPGTAADEVRRYISQVKPPATDGSPHGNCSFVDFLALTAEERWPAAVIAGQVTHDGGLFKELRGHARVKAWTDEGLRAAAIPCPAGAVSDQAIRNILENRPGEYHRDRLPALVYASDVSRGADLDDRTNTWCWIKLTQPSIDGLRQAFLDCESRVRLSTDPVPGAGAHVEALAWEGGFLDGQSVRLSPNLNVLVGGRGTGKSAVIETLRWLLDDAPIGQDDIRARAERLISKVLPPGTRVTAVVCGADGERSVVVRSTGVAAKVYDIDGRERPARPGDLVDVEVYSQHQLAALADEQADRRLLLDRFAPPSRSTARDLARARDRMMEAARRLNDLQADVERLRDRVAELPRHTERLAELERADLDESLDLRAAFDREQRLIQAIGGELDDLASTVAATDLRVEVEAVAETRINEMHSAALLRRIGQVIAGLNVDLGAHQRSLVERVERAVADVAEVRAQWERDRSQADERYQALLRSLGAAGNVMEEVRRLRVLIDELKADEQRIKGLEKQRTQIRDEWASLRSDWRSLCDGEVNRLRQAARVVRKEASGVLDVEVDPSGDRSELVALTDRLIPGRADAVRKVVCSEEFVLDEFVATIRAGADALKMRFGLPPGQAKALSALDESALLEIHAVDLRPTVRILLNKGTVEEPDWASLDGLSTGQQATALLTLLLIPSEGDGALVVDQPEDDLDNAFIAGTLVPLIRNEKLRRQILFSSHNANIPVLGDAELVIPLRATKEHGEMPVTDRGSIDHPPTATVIQQLLEGGQEAFERRKQKYGF